MKTNTAKKVIVSAMAIAMGAGIAGSISGTVAWYQYSTRATVEYNGVAAACTESLEISVNGTDYAEALTAEMIKTQLPTIAEKLYPVTSGALDLDSAPTDLYKNPIYQYTDQTTWGKGEANKDFAEFPIYARVKNIDGGQTQTYLKNKPVYLSDVTIKGVTADGKYDLTDAIRVAVWTGAGAIGAQTNAAAPFATYSAAAAVAAGVNTYGNLDLNNDAKLDTDQKYSFEDAGQPLVYGTANSLAKSYATTALAGENETTHKIANDADPAAIKGVALGNTDATDGHGVKICTIRIYLEGWSEIGNHAITGGDPLKTIWDVDKALNAAFNVGLRFSTTAIA